MTRLHIYDPELFVPASSMLDRIEILERRFRTLFACMVAICFLVGVALARNVERGSEDLTVAQCSYSTASKGQ